MTLQADRTSTAVHTAFDAHRELTVGLEEELMLLHPETHDLEPQAAVILDQLGGDARFKPELPAAQVEIVGSPAPTVGAAVAELGEARAALAQAADGAVVVAGGGVHPFARGDGVLTAGGRYAEILAEFGGVARRQLVFGLHVHVAIGGPARALAVHNAMREHLPAVAALSAASPFYEGVDTGLASVRPKLNELLPRQGIPPALASWDAYADAIAWQGRTGGFADARWWWEARLHPVHGTLEVRVADTQATVAETGAIAAVVHALVATLIDRHDAGELPRPAETWRIDDNRWSACRHGVAGTWVDVRTGRARPTQEHLHRLLDELGPAARRLGCAGELAAARRRIDDPPAERARALGPRALVAGNVEGYLSGLRANEDG